MLGLFALTLEQRAGLGSGKELCVLGPWPTQPAFQEAVGGVAIYRQAETDIL